MEKLYVALRDMQPVAIEIDEALAVAAKRPLDRMLEMAGRTVEQRGMGPPIIRFMPANADRSRGEVPVILPHSTSSLSRG